MAKQRKLLNQSCHDTFFDEMEQEMNKISAKRKKIDKEPPLPPEKLFLQFDPSKRLEVCKKNTNSQPLTMQKSQWKPPIKMSSQPENYQLSTEMMTDDKKTINIGSTALKLNGEAVRLSSSNDKNCSVINQQVDREFTEDDSDMDEVIKLTSSQESLTPDVHVSIANSGDKNEDKRENFDEEVDKVAPLDADTKTKSIELEEDPNEEFNNVEKGCSLKLPSAADDILERQDYFNMMSRYLNSYPHKDTHIESTVNIENFRYKNSFQESSTTLNSTLSKYKEDESLRDAMCVENEQQTKKYSSQSNNEKIIAVKLNDVQSGVVKKNGNVGMLGDVNEIGKEDGHNNEIDEENGHNNEIDDKRGQNEIDEEYGYNEIDEEYEHNNKIDEEDKHTGEEGFEQNNEIDEQEELNNEIDEQEKLDNEIDEDDKHNEWMGSQLKLINDNCNLILSQQKRLMQSANEQCGKFNITDTEILSRNEELTKQSANTICDKNFTKIGSKFGDLCGPDGDKNSAQLEESASNKEVENVNNSFIMSNEEGYPDKPSEVSTPSDQNISVSIENCKSVSTHNFKNINICDDSRVENHKNIVKNFNQEKGGLVNNIFENCAHQSKDCSSQNIGPLERTSRLDCTEDAEGSESSEDNVNQPSTEENAFQEEVKEDNIMDEEYSCLMISNSQLEEIEKNYYESSKVTMNEEPVLQVVNTNHTQFNKPIPNANKMIELKNATEVHGKTLSGISTQNKSGPNNLSSIPVNLPRVKWPGKMLEMQKNIREITREIDRLNGLLMNFRREIWPQRHPKSSEN
ncbi:repetitive organellar protein-like [Macrosteles quadrilineatus]|uniref:repetitive organellar protein-like n=1 Tax=Macrosteles quadrilineatus TaxID=74068 RepID=UPI0023E31314|nr:repetitive organellar protein-like [Macrosteles quadrilineatus]